MNTRAVFPFSEYTSLPSTIITFCIFLVLELTQPPDKFTEFNILKPQIFRLESSRYVK